MDNPNTGSKGKVRREDKINAVKHRDQAHQRQESSCGKLTLQEQEDEAASSVSQSTTSSKGLATTSTKRPRKRKREPSGYNAFFQEQWQETNGEGNGKHEHFRDFSRRIATRWKQLSPQERHRYEGKASKTHPSSHPVGVSPDAVRLHRESQAIAKYMATTSQIHKDRQETYLKNSASGEQNHNCASCTPNSAVAYVQQDSEMLAQEERLNRYLDEQQEILELQKQRQSTRISSSHEKLMARARSHLSAITGGHSMEQESSAASPTQPDANLVASRGGAETRPQMNTKSGLDANTDSLSRLLSMQQQRQRKLLQPGMSSTTVGSTRRDNPSVSLFLAQQQQEANEDVTGVSGIGPQREPQGKDQELTLDPAEKPHLSSNDSGLNERAKLDLLLMQAKQQKQHATGSFGLPNPLQALPPSLEQQVLGMQQPQGSQDHLSRLLLQQGGGQETASLLAHESMVMNGQQSRAPTGVQQVIGPAGTLPLASSHQQQLLLAEEEQKRRQQQHQNDLLPMLGSSVVTSSQEQQALSVFLHRQQQLSSQIPLAPARAPAQDPLLATLQRQQQENDLMLLRMQQQQAQLAFMQAAATPQDAAANLRRNLMMGSQNVLLQQGESMGTATSSTSHPVLPTLMAPFRADPLLLGEQVNGKPSNSSSALKTLPNQQQGYLQLFHRQGQPSSWGSSCNPPPSEVQQDQAHQSGDTLLGDPTVTLAAQRQLLLQQQQRTEQIMMLRHRQQSEPKEGHY